MVAARRPQEPTTDSNPKEATPPRWAPDRLPARRDSTRLQPVFVNLCGDYRFLRGGYWALVDAELNNVRSRPSPLDAVTAQNGAAALLVAASAGVPCASWKVARKADDVTPPCILVPNAGQTDTYYHVNSPRAAASQWRSATQNGTRAALTVQKTGPLRSMKTILGVTTSDPIDLAWAVWTTFGVPLATIWYLDTERGPLFVSIDPLPLHDLTERELRLYEEVAKRPMSRS